MVGRMEKILAWNFIDTRESVYYSHDNETMKWNSCYKKSLNCIVRNRTHSNTHTSFEKFLYARLPVPVWTLMEIKIILWFKTKCTYIYVWLHVSLCAYRISLERRAGLRAGHRKNVTRILKYKKNNRYTIWQNIKHAVATVIQNNRHINH